MPETTAEPWFLPGAGLSQTISGYEHRPEQQQMARRVEQALAGHARLAIEAGTGVGKSLAYLVPAALWAKAAQKRVAVSTYTKLLQTQLVSQDIPILSRLFAQPVTAAVAFGQENYLCLFRLESQVARGLFDTLAEARAADQLLDWAGKTETGVILDYPHALPGGLAARICRDFTVCRRDKCPFRRRCFYFRARDSWQRSSILIVNHSLLFSHLAADAGLLPECGAVILDEAHRIEDAAVKHFGDQASEHALATLLDRLASPRGGGLVQALGSSSGARRAIQTQASAARVELDRFFRT
ncbi:hypothetical protein FJY70_06190, partial [candidate division WOR-3 bacterium]|nr:hypothetical protein [candidate division WOR-3 bacterium]